MTHQIGKHDALKKECVMGLRLAGLRAHYGWNETS
jgi:hypothetical protein